MLPSLREWDQRRRLHIPRLTIHSLMGCTEKEVSQVGKSLQANAISEDQLPNLQLPPLGAVEQAETECLDPGWSLKVKSQ